MKSNWNPREADVERFTEGDCHIFARALNRVTGWPIHCINFGGSPSAHAFCVRPDGKPVDVEGVHPVRKFKNTWGSTWIVIDWKELRSHDNWGGPAFGDYSYSRAKKLAPELLAAI